MEDVCISCVKENKSTAIRLINKLKAGGIACRLTPRESENLENSEQTREKVIESAQVLIVIFSKIAENSKEIADDIETARKHNTAIVPFVTDKMPDSITMRYFLNTLDWIDAHGTNFDEAYEILIEVLKEKATGELAPVVPKKKKSTQTQAVSHSKSKYYIYVAIVGFALLGLWYIFSDKKEAQKDFQKITIPNNGSVSSNEADLVGEWKISDYEDSRTMSREERDIINQNVNAMKKNSLVIFYADKTFRRIGFTPQPQSGKWELDAVNKKILLTPAESERKEPMSLLSLNAMQMTIAVVEQVPDNKGGNEIVTTKLTFRKQLK